VDITSFDMRWNITNIGSARLTWIADHETLEIRTTYVGHGFQSLLQAAADLFHGSSASIAWLSNEPHAHVIVFTSADEYVYVQILHIPNENAADPWAGTKRLWAGRVPVSAFTAAATRMAQAVLNEYGETGYQREWRDIPFPTRELALLRTEL
jgi:hypothetical protein